MVSRNPVLFLNTPYSVVSTKSRLSVKSSSVFTLIHFQRAYSENTQFNLFKFSVVNSVYLKNILNMPVTIITKPETLAKAKRFPILLSRNPG